MIITGWFGVWTTSNASVITLYEMKCQLEIHFDDLFFNVALIIFQNQVLLLLNTYCVVASVFIGPGIHKLLTLILWLFQPLTHCLLIYTEYVIVSGSFDKLCFISNFICFQPCYEFCKNLEPIKIQRNWSNSIPS